MGDISRRDVVLAATGGLVAAGALAAADDKPKTDDRKSPTNGFVNAGPFEATAALVRSFDNGVYLSLSNGNNGWSQLDVMGHAVAAAAQAAGRKVWVKYATYDPNWGGGAGYFTGVRLAFDKGVF